MPVRQQRTNLDNCSHALPPASHSKKPQHPRKTEHGDARVHLASSIVDDGQDDDEAIKEVERIRGVPAHPKGQQFEEHLDRKSDRADEVNDVNSVHFGISAAAVLRCEGKRISGDD